jgi:hypothetical protein
MAGVMPVVGGGLSQGYLYIFIKYAQLGFSGEISRLLLVGLVYLI